MEIAKVTGTVVATCKDELVKGFKFLALDLLNAEDLSSKGINLVGVDIVDAGVGDIVLVVRGSSARTASGLANRPIDASIVGIIDAVIIWDKVIFRKK